jgi:hypothetical protein
MRYVVTLLAVLSTACAVGPNYRRPAVQIPDIFRAPEPLPPFAGNIVGIARLNAAMRKVG